MIELNEVEQAAAFVVFSEGQALDIRVVLSVFKFEAFQSILTDRPFGPWLTTFNCRDSSSAVSRSASCELL